jgi:bifunctional non-homologous end joining protein LigD
MEPIEPMEPKSSEKIPKGDDWVAQIKWDGVRILTYSDGTITRLFNRKKHERTLHYPELKDIRSYCDADSVILDGEVIALGVDGKPNFHEVMRRDGIRIMEKVREKIKAVPITYMVFDVLYLNGQWITDYPLEERLMRLNEIIIPNKQVQLVSAHDDAEKLFNVTIKHDMEGIIMKRKGSKYLIGEKKDVWLKVKNFHDLVGLIGGFTVRDGIVNAILLGLYDTEGRFIYIGHCGTGKLTSQDWKELTRILTPTVIQERPFWNKPERHTTAFWVEPRFAAKIKYPEWRWREGRSIRQPSIQSIVDVPIEECTFKKQLPV